MERTKVEQKGPTSIPPFREDLTAWSQGRIITRLAATGEFANPVFREWVKDTIESVDYLLEELHSKYAMLPSALMNLLANHWLYSFGNFTYFIAYALASKYRVHYEVPPDINVLPIPSQGDVQQRIRIKKVRDRDVKQFEKSLYLLSVYKELGNLGNPLNIAVDPHTSKLIEEWIPDLDKLQEFISILKHPNSFISFNKCPKKLGIRLCAEDLQDFFVELTDHNLLENIGELLLGAFAKYWKVKEGGGGESVKKFLKKPLNRKRPSRRVIEALEIQRRDPDYFSHTHKLLEDLRSGLKDNPDILRYLPPSTVTGGKPDSTKSRERGKSAGGAARGSTVVNRLAQNRAIRLVNPQSKPPSR